MTVTKIPGTLSWYDLCTIKRTMERVQLRKVTREAEGMRFTQESYRPLLIG